jgi:hypothetical protein
MSDNEGAFGSPDANAPEALSEGGVDVASPRPEVDAGLADAAPASDGSAGALPDAAPVVDAAPLDAAPEDAIVAAFCDAAWPITKSGRVICGPAEECAGLEVPWCFGPDGQGSCKLYPVECVGAQWHCMGGVTPSDGPVEPPTCQ